MSDPLTLAYLAGVIDSDGYITVTHCVRKGRSYFSARVGIAGTRRQPHDLASSIWGGKVSRYEPKNPRHRAQFQWSRDGDGAVPVIEAIQPYLRIKGDQAQIALEVQEHVQFGRGDDPYPWLSPDYDPVPHLAEMRAEVVRVLNQDRRMLLVADRIPDGPR
jgi:hypothetical protein